MSGSDKVIWLVCCGGLTGLGLIMSWLVARRRGARAGMQWAGWSLLPMAVYLTGADEMFWKIGVAIGHFAKGFAFSPRVWSGIALAGLAFVLLVSSGAVRGRPKVRHGKGKATEPLSTGSSALATQPAAGRGALAAPPPAAGAATQPAPAKLPQRRKPAAASGDDDMNEVEEILRRRGIS